MRTLNCVAPVVTGIGVPPEKDNVSLPGFEIAVKYVVEPLSLVTRASLKDAAVPAAKVTVSAVIESLPESVWKVNESRSLIASLGAKVLLPGSVPFASEVVAAPPVSVVNSGITEYAFRFTGVPPFIFIKRKQ